MPQEQSNPNQQGLDLSPEERLFDLLDSEDGTSSDDEMPDEPDKSSVDQIEDLLDGESETDETKDKSEEDDTEEDPDAEKDETAEQEEGEEDIFEITIDGETQDVSLTELSDGYLRQSDYTKKTQALSEERKEVQQLQQDLTQQRADLVSQIEAFKSLDQQALDELNKVNWDELKITDPEEFLVKKAEKADLIERITQAQKDQEEVAQQQLEANIQEFEKMRVQADEILRSEEGIPGWGDEEQTPILQKEMREAGLALGYTEEELGMAIDPRALKTLYLAAQFMKTQEAAPRIAAKKKDKVVPKVAKPGAKRKQTSAAAKRRQRARQTGTTRDAAAALYDLLGDDS